MKKLINAKASPIMLDACVLMVGINRQSSDSNFSFESMRQTYLASLFDYFKNIKIHEIVFNELDDARRSFINSYKDKNVEIVSEDNLYGKDPIYTNIFNCIASHDLFNYRRGESVFSIPYDSRK